MKSSTLCLTLASLLLATTSRAETIQIAAGVVCQPATAADVSRLDYSSGSARNVFTPPGSASQIATVVCALPTVAPGHVMVEAIAYFYDPARRWPRARCSFLNVSPGSAAHWATIWPIAAGSPIGTSSVDVDPFAFVPQAVSCSVYPGQSLYSVATRVEPLG